MYTWIESKTLTTLNKLQNMEKNPKTAMKVWTRLCSSFVYS